MAWKGKPNSVNHKVVASEKCISPRMVKPVLTMNHHHHYPFVYNVKTGSHKVFANHLCMAHQHRMLKSRSRNLEKCLPCVLKKYVVLELICGHVRDKDSIIPASEWNYNDTASFCKGFFGVEPRPNWITAEFGGHDIKRVLRRFGSNFIIFNGLRDPWRAHHVDLRFATSEDPKWLQDVRKGEDVLATRNIEPYRPIGLVKRSTLATRSIEPYFDGLVQLPIMSDIWAYEPGCFDSILKILKNKNSFLFSNHEAVLSLLA
ncbi:hypothetical protein D5086_029232 [Populus alba]|uniref:Uncharacterized protein n=1 Tax=Populus alba TaxID=43335 RepID=A0ACC4AT01_POPAL